MIITRPEITEYPSYYTTYINKPQHNDLLTALTESSKDVIATAKAIPQEKLDYRYAEGKWSIKEVFAHMIDAERIFAYRALRFARNDKTPLAGFEENDYTPESNATARNIEDMIEEYGYVRNGTIALYKSFTAEMCMRKGNANGKEISVRAIGFVIAGHDIHHLQVIKERYIK